MKQLLGATLPFWRELYDVYCRPSIFCNHTSELQENCHKRYAEFTKPGEYINEKTLYPSASQLTIVLIILK